MLRFFATIAAFVLVTTPAMGEDGPIATGSTLCRGYSAMGNEWRIGYVREGLGLYFKTRAAELTHREMALLIEPQHQDNLLASVDARCKESPDAAAVNMVFQALDQVISKGRELGPLLSK